MVKFAGFRGVDPNWTGADNTIDTAGVSTEQAFVYDGTNDRLAGKVSRSTTDTYLASELAADMDLDDALSFDVTFEYIEGTSGGVYVGFFNSRADIRHISSLGMFIQANGGNIVIRPQVWTVTGRGEQFNGEYQIVPADLASHTVTLNYNPNGAAGLGTISVTVDSVALHPLNVEYINSITLLSGFRTDGATFNRFGVRNLWWVTGADFTFALSAVAYSDATGRRVVDLTSDPGWIGSGNNTTFTDTGNLTNQNFGFKGTSYASRDGSDIGGLMIRKEPDGVKCYYADTLTQTLSFDDYIEFRGYVALEKQNVDSVVHIGYFLDADQAGGPPGTWAPNILGLLIGGQTNDGHGMRPFYVTDASEITTIPAGTQLPADLVRRAFHVVYDPDIGFGRITVWFRGEITTLDLTEAHRATGATFDRFGIWPQNLSGGGPMQIYFACLGYTHKH